MVAAALLPGASAMGQASGPRLLVVDLSYARVREAARHALAAYPLARDSGGVIESARVERVPRPEEPGVDRVAERITVRVDPVGARITRVTVTVETEVLRRGRWQPGDGSGATVRAVLDRIRAGIG
jgi:hypothetical protein